MEGREPEVSSRFRGSLSGEHQSGGNSYYRVEEEEEREGGREWKPGGRDKQLRL